jgi:hypothetical protein
MAGDPTRKNNYFPIVWQIILIISFLIGLGITWEQLDGRVDSLEKEHERHCIAQKEQFSRVPNAQLVALQFEHISKMLDGIQDELIACRGADDKLQETMQKILMKLK